jgi:hypothetical protein
MPSRRTPTRCVCGCTYEECKTGLTFADVRKMMWRASDDPKEWRQKRRRSVLGFWKELKLELWEQFHGFCSEMEKAA